MDRTDWLLCIGVTAAFAAAFGMLIPKFGWAVGAGLAVIALIRARKKRESISSELSEQPGEDK